MKDIIGKKFQNFLCLYEQDKWPKIDIGVVIFSVETNCRPDKLFSK